MHVKPHAWEVCRTGKNCLRFEANLGYSVRLHLTKKNLM